MKFFILAFLFVNAFAHANAPKRIVRCSLFSNKSVQEFKADITGSTGEIIFNGDKENFYFSSYTKGEHLYKVTLYDTLSGVKVEAQSPPQELNNYLIAKLLVKGTFMASIECQVGGI